MPRRSPTPPTRPELPALRFDPELDCSPYELYRRLCDGEAPALVDLREAPEETLRGARSGSAHDLADWHPDDGAEAVLLDADGTRAREVAAALRARGVTGVRALFGGLRLYDHALDPRVVGTARHLVTPGTR